MPLRIPRLVIALAIAAVVLAGCTPTQAAAPADDSPGDVTTPSAEPTQEQEVQLPDDAVLGMTMRATADTGAQVDISLVLLAPAALDSAAGAPRAAATLDWCQGELDESVITAQGGFSFGQLDVTVTPVEGSAAWPTDLPLHAMPAGDSSGTGPTLAAGGGAYSVQRPAADAAESEGYYIPHCLQDVFVPAPGTGSVYLGWGNDGTALGAWATSYYGATFDQFGEPAGSPRATLEDCSAVITDLGKSMGASEATLPDHFSATQCRVGDAA